MASTDRSRLPESGTAIRGRVRMLSTVTAGISLVSTRSRSTLFQSKVNQDADRDHDRGSGGLDLGAMDPYRRAGGGTRAGLSVAIRPFLQPHGPSRAARLGVLDIA